MLTDAENKSLKKSLLSLAREPENWQPSKADTGFYNHHPSLDKHYRKKQQPSQHFHQRPREEPRLPAWPDTNEGPSHLLSTSVLSEDAKWRGFQAPPGSNKVPHLPCQCWVRAWSLDFHYHPAAIKVVLTTAPSPGCPWRPCNDFQPHLKVMGYPFLHCGVGTGQVGSLDFHPHLVRTRHCLSLWDKVSRIKWKPGCPSPSSGKQCPSHSEAK